MEKYRKVVQNYKFKISAPTQNDKFKLPDRSHSVSDVQDYFEYFIKIYETVPDNPPITIYVNIIENKIIFETKAEYYLKRLTSQTMKLLGSNKNKTTKDENGENVPHLEFAEVVLVHCNFVKNNYQHNSRILYILVSNKSFGQLLHISPKNVIFLKTFSS